MKKNIKELSIIFVIYKQSKKYILDLLESTKHLKNIEKNINLFFILDDPETNYDNLIKNNLKNSSFDYRIIKSKLNINKTQQIFNLIPSLNSHYVKIVDGDDKLAKADWKKNISILKETNEDIIITKYIRNNASKNKKIYVNEKRMGKYNGLNFEPRIIYKTSSLKEITNNLNKKFNFINHSYMDDQIRIWNILQLTNAKYTRKKILTTEYNTSSGRTKDPNRNINEVINSMYKVFSTLNNNKINGYWFRHNLGLYLFPKFVILNRKENIFFDDEIYKLMNKISIITDFSIKKINRKIKQIQKKNKY